MFPPEQRQKNAELGKPNEKKKIQMTVNTQSSRASTCARKAHTLAECIFCKWVCAFVCVQCDRLLLFRCAEWSVYEWGLGDVGRSLRNFSGGLITQPLWVDLGLTNYLLFLTAALKCTLHKSVFCSNTEAVNTHCKLRVQHESQTMRSISVFSSGVT